MADPRYSNTQPVPPADSDPGQKRQNDILGRHSGLERSIHLDFEGLRRPLQQALRASTCSTSLVPMPNARAPNAPCVAVWLSRTPPSSGLRQPQLRSDHVHDALALAVDSFEGFRTACNSLPVDRAVLRRTGRRWAASGPWWECCGRRVRRSSGRALSDRAGAGLESLRRVTLAQVQVDIEQRRGAGRSWTT